MMNAPSRAGNAKSYCLADIFFAHNRAQVHKKTIRRLPMRLHSRAALPLSNGTRGFGSLRVIAVIIAPSSARSVPNGKMATAQAPKKMRARAASTHHQPTRSPLAHTPWAFAPMPLSRSRSGTRVRLWLALYWIEHSPELRHFQCERARQMAATQPKIFARERAALARATRLALRARAKNTPFWFGRPKKISR